MAGEIRAPLAGKIIQISVSVGEQVQEEDEALVMEAMKMENQVLADRQGVIESIPVMQGDSVLQGDTLVYII